MRLVYKEVNKSTFRYSSGGYNISRGLLYHEHKNLFLFLYDKFQPIFAVCLSGIYMMDNFAIDDGE